MKIGKKDFDFEHHFYVMGILNITPDSFSDGGRYLNPDDAVEKAAQMIEDGADIIDIGGESTRPGYQEVSDDEEMSRVCPVIGAIKERFDIPVSLDTSKSSVAKAGISAGADLINDVWGLKKDADMAKLIAISEVPCVIMHNRKTPDYENFLEDVITDLSKSVEIAVLAGIAKENIILDAGIGFAKNAEQNLLLLNNLTKIKEIGFPLMLGTSRKSVIGKTLDLPVDEREEGTLATSVLGLKAGCSIFRVHDVKMNVRALKMTEAILNADFS